MSEPVYRSQQNSEGKGAERGLILGPLAAVTGGLRVKEGATADNSRGGSLKPLAGPGGLPPPLSMFLRLGFILEGGLASFCVNPLTEKS